MKTNNSDIRHNSGFTLIEVMIALVIIAISLTGMAVTMGGMLDNATAVRERTYASWIAQNEITLVRAKRQWTNKSNKQGSVEMAGREWLWKMSIKNRQHPIICPRLRD